MTLTPLFKIKKKVKIKTYTFMILWTKYSTNKQTWIYNFSSNQTERKTNCESVLWGQRPFKSEHLIDKHQCRYWLSDSFRRTLKADVTQGNHLAIELSLLLGSLMRYIHINIHIYIYIYVFIYIYIYKHIYICVCMCVCVCVFTNSFA